MSDPCEIYDHYECYCSRLGHDVHFGYCRRPGSDIPCRRIFECWSARLNIMPVLRSYLSEQQIANITAPPPDKAVTLHTLIHNVRKRQELQP